MCGSILKKGIWIEKEDGGGDEIHADFDAYFKKQKHIQKTLESRLHIKLLAKDGYLFLGQHVYIDLTLSDLSFLKIHLT